MLTEKALSSASSKQGRQVGRIENTGESALCPLEAGNDVPSQCDHAGFLITHRVSVEHLESDPGTQLVMDAYFIQHPDVCNM